MKRVALWLWLVCWPVWSQNIRIQENRFETRHMVRQGRLYVLLEPFSAALGVRLQAAGEGYWGSLQEGEGPGAVPAGYVQVGAEQIALLLENGDVFVPAEAYCQALGLKIRRDAGGGLHIGAGTSAPALPRKRLAADPESFFVTQYRSRYNEWAPRSSGNCGPACMAMVALAYGRVPPGLLPGDRQGLILWCRQAMTLGNGDESRGTRCREVQRVASLLGLDSHWIRKYQDMAAALEEGKMLVVGGDTSKLGSPGGDHFLLCVGRQGSDYVINDPGGFFPIPGTRLPESVMEQFFHEAIAVYPRP